MRAGRLVIRRNDGMVKRVSSRRGFTLVELSLSMVFIAILSIIIVLVINGTVSSYSRGVTLNLVNTVGTEIMNEMKTAIHGAPTFKSFEDLCGKYYENSSDSSKDCISDNASGLISIVRRGDIQSKSGEKTNDVPIFGAICLGNYSYLWNSGYLFNPDYDTYVASTAVEGKLTLETLWGGPGNKPEPIWSGKLLRIKDDERWVCMGLMNQLPETYISRADSRFDPENDSFFLIGLNKSLVDMDLTYVIVDDANNGGVAVYDLEVDTTTIGDGVLYSISMTLGTVRSGIHINAQGGSCATRAEAENNFDYCAINKFKITALASGGTKK